MKTQMRLFATGMMVAALSAFNLSAQDSTKTSSGAVSAPANPTTQVQMSSGVADVLRLTKSSVADETVVAFVNNSSASYNLSASDVIYLKEQGVPASVITAMLNHRNTASVANAPANKTPATSVWASSVPAHSAPVTVAQTYVPPATVYVASPVPSYRYYYPAYDYWPPVSLSFGFGYSRWGGGHHRHGGHGRR